LPKFKQGGIYTPIPLTLILTLFPFVWNAHPTPKSELFMRTRPELIMRTQAELFNRPRQELFIRTKPGLFIRTGSELFMRTHTELIDRPVTPVFFDLELFNREDSVNEGLHLKRYKLLFEIM